MKLTKEQIQNLYEFTEQHHVEYYDLQTELVDHLANDIEQVWAKEPYLTFEKARYKATIKFGLKGFSTFVRQKEKELKKENWRLFKQFFVEFFKLPKVALTLLLVALVYLGFEFVNDKTSLLFITLIVIDSLAFFYALLLGVKYTINRKRTGKKWLFQQVITGSGPFLAFITIFQPYQFYQFLQSDISINWSFTVQLLCSVGIVLFGLVFYIALWIIPPKFEDTIEKHKVA